MPPGPVASRPQVLDCDGAEGGLSQQVALVIGVIVLPRLGAEQVEGLVERHGQVPAAGPEASSWKGRETIKTVDSSLCLCLPVFLSGSGSPCLSLSLSLSLSLLSLIHI